MVQLLKQQPHGANAVERLRERGEQKLIGQRRWPTFCGVVLTNGEIDPIERLIRQFPVFFSG